MPQPPWAFHSFWNTNCRVRSLSVSQCGLLLAMTYENNGMSMVWWCDTSRLTIKHLCDISCLEGCAHPTQPLIAAEQEAHNVAVFRVKPDSTVILCQNRHLNRGKGSVCSMAWDKKNGNRLLVVSQHSLVVFHYITYPEDKHELLPVYEYMPGRTGLPFRLGGCGFWSSQNPYNQYFFHTSFIRWIPTNEARTTWIPRETVSTRWVPQGGQKQAVTHSPD